MIMLAKYYKLMMRAVLTAYTSICICPRIISAIIYSASPIVAHQSMNALVLIVASPPILQGRDCVDAPIAVMRVEEGILTLILLVGCLGIGFAFTTTMRCAIASEYAMVVHFV